MDLDLQRAVADHPGDSFGNFLDQWGAMSVQSPPPGDPCRSPHDARALTPFTRSRLARNPANQILINITIEITANVPAAAKWGASLSVSFPLWPVDEPCSRRLHAFPDPEIRLRTYWAWLNQMSQLEPWAIDWAMEQTLYTRQFFAQNPQLLAPDVNGTTAVSPPSSPISSATSSSPSGSGAVPTGSSPSSAAGRARSNAFGGSGGVGAFVAPSLYTAAFLFLLA